MKKHELKILPKYFQAVWSGIKTFELRKDDRDYQRGDILVLREWDGEEYTGSAICVKVTYILQNAEKYGLKDGYVIMGIRHLEAAGFRPVVRGKWERMSDNDVFGDIHCKCSACGEDWWQGPGWFRKARFCPNCGADMREES